MRLSRTAAAAAVLFLLTASASLTGCAIGNGAAGNTTGGSGGTNNSAGNPESQQSLPVVVKSASESPAEKQGTNPSPNENFQPPKPQLGVPAAEARTPFRGKKLAYLTFDDGPNTDYTEKILDILRKKKVKATFMVVGKNVRLNPRILQRTLADGHALANHTYSHDYNIVYRSPDAFLADLDENNRYIMKYTGKPVMLFRAPGGNDKMSQEFNKKIRSRGYISVGWNISAVDSDPNGVTQAQVYNNIMSGLERVEKLKLTPIILMHDGTQLATTEAKPGSALAAYIQNRNATMGALPYVIDSFLAKGYTFTVVDENTPPAW